MAATRLVLAKCRTEALSCLGLDWICFSARFAQITTKPIQYIPETAKSIRVLLSAAPMYIWKCS
ncbi:hypothetical protein SERLA73DRAFT_184671 [Serpula lacrymans var. lacrymans S7.3]|uniref:Uncharacterized protein n=2 Tax=Serpula lacrymans var. lacrymans TaxID=341189 RepID=F8Q4W5_SERL3|nr:uncharacterized protein SERLADRAFT_472583 [Serpula lacrymans var. lacrymans S7.9]EGN96592.1 hypothetical protein SERLA73DRAFT_184671 [Serpula lacrymans var. lacrymans S7.3]EGO22162.1 hypothetical protein SERLADRAFT_472583 [Serpula lacrymans var. lacrymans S7.9]